MLTRRPGRLLVSGVALALGLGACSLSGGHSAPRALPPVTRLTVPATTTPPGVQTSGPRTVLSPIGLNLRAQPSKSAKVLGTAAQGVVLDVLGHSNQPGGWFKVKGATVSGWISGSTTFSAPGKFSAFTSNAHQFAALYPAAWTVTESSASAVFRAPPGNETIVVATAPNIGKLGRGRAGYLHSHSESIVVCGVTSYLDTYTQESTSTSTSAAPRRTAPDLYLVEVRLTLDPKHALGIDANLTDLSELQTVRDFANSVTFPFPQCQG